ncbi:unnamed protein product [Ceratitis capitata]|uniref:(Mediterranean fruit fly) hypothetical protein n=1 Tax=Ceratitis capitata TaxID=7213 RepID=A0A811UPA3_CERCA|nr:unnamed protein product [Ceratitis capitata]
MPFSYSVSLSIGFSLLQAVLHLPFWFNVCFLFWCWLLILALTLFGFASRHSPFRQFDFDDSALVLCQAYVAASVRGYDLFVVDFSSFDLIAMAYRFVSVLNINEVNVGSLLGQL